MQTALSQPTDSRRFGTIRRAIPANLGIDDQDQGDVPWGLPYERPDDPDDFPDAAISDDTEDLDDAENARSLADELLQLRYEPCAHQRAICAEDIAHRLVLPSYLRNAQDAATRKWWAADEWTRRASAPVRACLVKIEKVVRCFDAIINGWDLSFGDDARALREAVIALRKLARHFDAAAASERARADVAYRRWQRQCRARRLQARSIRCSRRACSFTSRTRSRSSRRARTVARVVARTTGDPDPDPEPPRRRASSSGGAS